MPAPPAAFVNALQKRNVAPLSVGRVIVATRVPHETAVLETIRKLGLESQIIFNKGAVMILPPGVNKKTGLAAALDELGLTFGDAVGIGDAENDLAFLGECGCRRRSPTPCRRWPRTSGSLANTAWLSPNWWR